MTRDIEGSAHRFRGLDTWGRDEILEALWSGQSRAVAACLPALPALTAAVNAAVDRLAAAPWGRLVYAGAGSSGVIAALDAMELRSTFGWPPARTVILLAGGLDLVRGLEGGAEDDDSAGRARARATRLSPADVVLGISASGGSSFTVAVLQEARCSGAMTLAIANVAGSPLEQAAEHAIVIPTGAEVIAGSTRLGAGTAQKVALNLLSTTIMVGLGFVFDNLMIHMRPENTKLRRRQIAMVARIVGVDEELAASAIGRHGDVKRAVLVLAGLSEAEADVALAQAGGNLRQALAAVQPLGRRTR